MKTKLSNTHIAYHPSASYLYLVGSHSPHCGRDWRLSFVTPVPCDNLSKVYCSWPLVGSKTPTFVLLTQLGSHTPSRIWKDPTLIVHRHQSSKKNKKIKISIMDQTLTFLTVISTSRWPPTCHLCCIQSSTFMCSVEKDARLEFCLLVCTRIG